MNNVRHIMLLPSSPQFTDFLLTMVKQHSMKTRAALLSRSQNENSLCITIRFSRFQHSIPSCSLHDATMGQWDRAYLYARSNIFLGSTINDKQWLRATWFHLTFPKKRFIFHTPRGDYYFEVEVWLGSGEEISFFSRASIKKQQIDRKSRSQASSMFNDHCRVRVIILSLISKFVWICLFLGFFLLAL